MSRTTIEKETHALISQIKKYGPQLAPFFDLDISLREYAPQLYQYNTSDVHLKRQELVRTKLRAKLKALFGEECEDALHINLDGPLTFNIADHHQVLNHPFLVSSNYISSVHKFLQPQKPDAIITISSGDVPPNNFFSRFGFQFHDKRVPIFGTAEREYSSYYVPSRDFNFVERLKKANRWGEFTKEEQEFLIAEYEKIKSFDYSRCQNYIDQISIIVKNTWPYLFEESLRPTIPELLYMTQEELTAECLMGLLKEDSFVSACLFDQKFREQVLDTFRGIVVAWNEATEKGTHFFWRKYPGEPRSLRMYVKGDKLVPADTRFTHLAVPLEQDAIIELLRTKEIYPSLFMIFTVLNFWAGIKPLVGYGSVMYLHLMKQAWLKALEGTSFADEVADLNGVDTTGFVAGLAVFFKHIEGKIKALYAYDIFFDGGIKQEYLARMREMKFKDLLSVALPEMYAYYANKYIPEPERMEPKVNFDDLASITFGWL